MKKYITALTLMFITLLNLHGFELTEADLSQLKSADEIMADVEATLAVDSEIELIQISTKNETGQNEAKTFLSMIRRDPTGNYSYIIRFISPESVKDVTLLTVESGEGDAAQYMYLPALGSVKQIKGEGQSKSFMGTDFNFDDLKKEKSPDYMYSRQFDTDVDGKVCYTILSAPADQNKLKMSGFTSRMIYVDPATNQILKIEFYDEEDNIRKTFKAYDYNSVEVDGPTKRPMRAVMINHENGSTSEIKIIKSRLNYQLDEQLFTVETLESWNDDITKTYMAVFDTPQAKDAVKTK
jgi:hypothetical protein